MSTTENPYCECCFTVGPHTEAQLPSPPSSSPSGISDFRCWGAVSGERDNILCRVRGMRKGEIDGPCTGNIFFRWVSVFTPIIFATERFTAYKTGGLLWVRLQFASRILANR